MEKVKRDIIGEWQKRWAEDEKNWRLKKRQEKRAAREPETNRNGPRPVGEISRGN